MDISNKTLGLLLVAAIVVSVGGTFFSLDKLNGFSSTGFVTDGTGAVNLTINTSVSIVMNDSVIDFGTCTISGGTMTFDSNNTAGGGDNAACNGTFPDFMTVENDGNTNANVTVEISTLPTTEYADATGATIDFKTADNPTDGGCTTPYTWTNFAATSPTNYPACDILTTLDGADQFDFYVRITLPDTATDNDDGSMGITFTASAS